MNIEERLAALEEEVATLREELTTLKKQQPVRPVRKPYTPPPRTTDKRDYVLNDALFWLARICMFVFLIGIIWFFQAAYAEGWIGRMSQLALGYSIGGCLYFFASWERKHEREKSSVLVFAISVLTLTLTTFIGHYIFKSMHVAAAYLLHSATIGYGLYFVKKWKMPLLLPLMLGIGVFIPYFLSIEQSPLVFVLYLLTIYGVTMWFNEGMQHKLVAHLTHPMYYMSLILYAVTNDSNSDLALFSLVLIGIGAVVPFAYYSYWYAPRMAWLTPNSKIATHLGIVVGVFLALYAQYAVYASETKGLFIGVLFALSLMGIGGVYVHRAQMQWRLSWAVAANFFFWAAVITAAGSSELWTALITMNSMVYVAYAAHLKNDKLYQLTYIGSVFMSVVYVDFVGNLFAFESEPQTSELLGYSGVVLATVLLVIKVARAYPESGQRTSAELYSLAHFVTFSWFLYNYSTGTLSMDETFVSIGLSGYVLAVGTIALVFARRKQRMWLERCGFGLIVVTLIKVVFIDAATVSMLLASGVFLVIGALGILLANQYVTKRKQKN
ncbi:MAG: hypothetical protein ACRC5C_10215 [Bacilli bacterium]